jgi:hypothetical protein
VSIGEILFPYRAKRSFGVISLAFLFLVLLAEIELVVFVGLGLVAHRADLFIDLQADILPAAVIVSLVSSSVFAWRARAWTRARIAGISEWGGPASSAYGEKLAARRANQP